MSRVFLDFHDVTFRYDSTTTPILQGFSAHFPPGWTGIIGANGAGKTTFLRLAAGTLTPSLGSIRASAEVIYCAQGTDEPPGRLMEFLQATDPMAARLHGQLRLEMDWPSRWGVLSHGERKRAQIAVALWCRPEILAADEPTNHVDLEAQRLLRQALHSFRGVGLLVSHDRALLDELCQRCLIFEPPHVVLRPGGYSRVTRIAQAERVARRRAREAAKDKLRGLQQEVARRAEEAAGADRKRSKRNLARHDSDAREKIDRARMTGKDGKAGRLLSQLSGRLRQAQETVEHLRVAKEYQLGIEFTGTVSTRNALFSLPPGTLPLGEARTLVYPELAMAARDRIAITGPNGAGKSTLLRCIVSNLNMAAERVIYLPQELDPAIARQSVAELRRLPSARLGEVMAYVSRLGSRPEPLLVSENPSPGEMRKILLALGITLRPHLIIMDEPTNHLDLPSIECMEDALDATVCGLLLVAHDERFLARLTDQRWIIEPKQQCRSTFELRIETKHGYK